MHSEKRSMHPGKSKHHSTDKSIRNETSQEKLKYRKSASASGTTFHPLAVQVTSDVVIPVQMDQIAGSRKVSPPGLGNTQGTLPPGRENMTLGPRLLHS